MILVDFLAALELIIWHIEGSTTLSSVSQGRNLGGPKLKKNLNIRGSPNKPLNVVLYLKSRNLMNAHADLSKILRFL